MVKFRTFQAFRKGGLPGVLIRASERCRATKVAGFERRQMEALTTERDRNGGKRSKIPPKFFSGGKGVVTPNCHNIKVPASYPFFTT